MSELRSDSRTVRQAVRKLLAGESLPTFARFSSAEGVDVGASTTEDDKNLAKVGSDNPVSRVFGRSAVTIHD